MFRNISFFDFMGRKLAFHIKGNYFFWMRASYMFKDMTGIDLNWEKPKSFREKLMWLMRFDQNPLKTICADKYMVRQYVKEKSLEAILVPLISSYDNISEIDFETLPEKFVLKCNHGSGCNIIVLDKSRIDKLQILKQLDNWMKTDYSNEFCEIHYKNIPRKIICEKLLSPTAPTEYQCWCVNGEPESLLVCRKNYDGTYDAGSYSTEFVQLYDRLNEKNMSDVFKKPKCLDEILNYARILSADFAFVRADFYEVNGKVYFAELTFTPNGNYLTSYKKDFDDRLGKKLVLPH